jgi:hypothetical protein
MAYRLAFYVCIGASVFGMVGCGGDDGPAKADDGATKPALSGSVRGTAVLFDTLTHANTRVTLRVAGWDPASAPESARAAFTAETDAAGLFTFTDVPAGTYTVTYEHESYVPRVRDNVVVSDSARGDLDLGVERLSRSRWVVDGQEIGAGTRGPGGEHQFFQIDGDLFVYDHGKGATVPIVGPAGVVGGVLSPDGTNALLFSGTSPSTSSPNTVHFARVGANDAPRLVSANALVAGLSPSGARGFVLAPSGPSQVDLFSFETASAEVPAVVAAKVSSSALIYVPDPRFPRVGPFVTPVYAQLAFENNDRVFEGVQVRDFRILTTDTGELRNVRNVVSRQSLPLPANASSDALATQILVTVTTGSSGRDIYLWEPGVAPPVRLNDAPLTGPVSIDTSSAPGRALVLSAELDGSTRVSAFDLTGAPRFRTVVPRLLWSPGSQLLSTLSSRGRRDGRGRYYALTREGDGISVVKIDLTSLEATPVVSGITRVNGGAPSSFDDLTSSQLVRGLDATRFLMNVRSNGTELTPIVVDDNGAHEIRGSFSTQVFSNLVMNRGGSAVAFFTSTPTAHVASIPAVGSTTPSSIPLSQTPSTIAVSEDGTTLALGSSTGVVTMTSNGNDVATVCSASGSPSRVWFEGLAVLASTSSGQVAVGRRGAAASCTTFGSSGFNARSFGFSDPTRLIVQDGTSTPRYVDVSVTPPLVSTLDSANTVVMNGRRTRAFLLPTLAAVDARGSVVSYRNSYALIETVSPSPNGAFMYFRQTSGGEILAFGETGEGVQLSAGLVSSSSSYLRVLRDGAAFAFIENAERGGRDLSAVDSDTGTKTVVVPAIYGSAFDSGSLSPWVSPDRSTVFGLGDANAGVTDAEPKARFAAYRDKRIVLGDDVVVSPAPRFDTARSRVTYRAAQNPLHGTATLLSYDVGAAGPTTIAENVRSFALSPREDALAIVSVRNNALELRSGRFGEPSVSMGVIGFADLQTGSNVVFSDDARRLFAFDQRSSGGGSSPGWLVTGGVGEVGLVAVTNDVLGVFPNGNGERAAVLTRNPRQPGRLLQQFVLRR